MFLCFEKTLHPMKLYGHTVELHLSRLTGMANHPNKQKIRIFVFFLNRLHWQFEDKKIYTNACCKPCIYLCANKTLIHNLLYVFDNWEKKLSYSKL